MSTIVTKIIGQLPGRPSAAGGMLWSLGLHATVFAVSYTWWSSPMAPISFAGNRYVVQMEATFAEMPTEQEIETELERESTLPEVELSPAELPQLPRELVVDRRSLRQPESLLQDEEVLDTVEVNPLHNANPLNEPPEVKPVETPARPRRQPIQPPVLETVAVVEQFAGVDDRVPPDLSGNRPPSYPAEAILRRLEGVVLLRVCIAATGQVERVGIAESSGHAILDHAAVEAVSMWRARPGEQAGKSVATVEILPIRFRL